LAQLGVKADMADLDHALRQGFRDVFGR
jgi:hypothetical protein